MPDMESFRVRRMRACASRASSKIWVWCFRALRFSAGRSFAFRFRISVPRVGGADVLGKLNPAALVHCKLVDMLLSECVPGVSLKFRCLGMRV